jgi:hypothetical protein
MKRSIQLSLLVALAVTAALVGALAAAAPARADVVIERFDSAAAFKARLAGGAFPVKLIAFDGITATKNNAVSFSATKYRAATGMLVKGEKGQYVSRAFHSPSDFVAVSKPNMYAPGPVAWSGPDGSGGNETNVTFYAGGKGILAAGFGCYFIDADWPGDGPASFAIFDAQNAALGDTGVVVTANAGRAFVGLVAVDSITNKPIPAIKRVYIVNGSGWLGNDNNEGVALDNFMAGTATYGVSGKVLRSSGAAFKGVRVTLKGSYTVTATTDASGRYTFRNVPSGTYSVAPKKTGYTFLPTKRTATVAAANVTVKAFRAR